MIICSQCGQAAPEDAKFCDYCGQGLSAKPPEEHRGGLEPLEPGMVVGGFEVVDLVGRLAEENRYRVTRTVQGRAEYFQLRERKGPQAQAEAPPTEPAASADEEASGPRAKTKELKPIVPEFTAEPSSDLGVSAPSEEAMVPPAIRPDSEETAEPANQEGAQSIDGAAQSATAESLPEAGPEQAAQEEAAVAAAEPVDDLGELFGRVLALSLSLGHPAFQAAIEGFSEGGRVYLVYADETLIPVARRKMPMAEHEAISLALQVCQAVGFLHRRGLRLNDICPESVAFAADGRVKLTGLDYVSNDLEVQSEPIFNDGYTAPEVYGAKKVDKRADIFSIGALLYTCLTGERLESESWRGEAGAVRFYPPHVVSPELEDVVRRALIYNPGDRWPSVEAFKAELVRLNSLVRIRAAAMTDVGMVRELNEDSVLTLEFRRDSVVDAAHYFLYLVADGMGGAEAGETASAIAVAAVRNYVEDRVGSQAKDLCGLLRAAIEEANLKIQEYQVAHPEARGMGSTAVGALVVPPDGAMAWVGDSRGYLLEGGKLRQVTKDHSLVQRLIEIGQITVEEARHHEHKNVITRSLGAKMSGAAGAETVALRLRRGSRLLLCSDGLTSHVEDREIEEIMARHSDPADAARELIVAANAGGGSDNISVVTVFAD